VGLAKAQTENVSVKVFNPCQSSFCFAQAEQFSPASWFCHLQAVRVVNNFLPHETLAGSG
jgi:hypothetical protein